MTFGVSHPDIRLIVNQALTEDLGSGDITTNSIVAADARAEARFMAKQDMTVAGIELLTLLFDDVALLTKSGDRVATGTELARVRTDSRTLLSRERVSLNFLQRLSGVATLAAKFVAEVQGTGVKILDTRKTTPGLRVLEKMASCAGGATNHRMGLYDAVLIKNNHIRLAGGVAKAIDLARAALSPPLRPGFSMVERNPDREGGDKSNKPIEVEVRTRLEIDEALSAGAARILLDNMSPSEAATEVAYIAHRAETEISGGITLANVRAYAEAHPDFISTGAITHSAVAVDINCGIYPIN